MSQSYDLHRALLRPAIIHILRASGFHSTKPSVLDTLVNLAERYLMLLSSTTASQALITHNDPIPTVTDIRMAFSECSVLSPVTGAAEEDWRERMRRPLSEIEKVENGGRARAVAERRRREEEDLRDVREFERWFDSPQHAEMRRIAGLMPDATTALVGVGGGVVQAEDFLTVLKRKLGKTGEDARYQGTVMGKEAEDRVVVIEGGPVGSLRDWRPPVQQQQAQAQVQAVDAPASKELETLEQAEDEDMQDVSSETLGVEDAAMEDEGVSA